MNPLDIGVVAVIVLSAIFAFARGFVREALSIVAWVGAAFVTLRGFGAAFAVIDPMVKNPLLSQLIAGFGLFVISLVILTIITSIIARYVRTSSLSAIDRTLGFVFGVARGVLIVSLAYLLLDAAVAKDDRPVWVQQAKSTPYLHWGADELKVFLPEQLKFRNAGAADEIIRTIDAKAVGEELAKKAAGALVNPTPVQAAKPDQPAATPAYRPGEQKRLNQLFDNQSR
ncbi:MAG TPA: CvpA family protein [Stellaceae bacterium]|jgi:membrane protein required for colicin V production|nr:CvpA family protein [Stellaceae bacterium]